MARDNSRELEVQRRVTEALSSAGVGHGRISQEVLYMMPPEFSKMYQDLFWRGLKENVSPGEGSGKRDENVARKIDANWKPKGRVDKKTGEKVPGTRLMPGGGGKKYRTYWTVKDEEALKIKASVDRALRRLAGKIDRELRALERGNQLEGAGVEACVRCEYDLALVKELLRPVHYCPRCGEGVR